MYQPGPQCSSSIEKKGIERRELISRAVVLCIRGVSSQTLSSSGHKYGLWDESSIESEFLLAFPDP